MVSFFDDRLRTEKEPEEGLTKSSLSGQFVSNKYPVLQMEADYRGGFKVGLQELPDLINAIQLANTTGEQVMTNVRLLERPSSLEIDAPCLVCSEILAPDENLVSLGGRAAGPCVHEGDCADELLQALNEIIREYSDILTATNI